MCARKYRAPLPSSFQARATVCLGEGQGTSISHPPSPMVQRLSSRWAQPRGWGLPSSTQPSLITGWKPWSTKSLIAARTQGRSFTVAEANQAQKLAPLPRDLLKKQICQFQRGGRPFLPHSSWAVAQRFCPEGEAGHYHRELWCSSQGSWLDLE